MNIIYNNQEDFARGIKDFLLKSCTNIRKTQIKIIPYIILGMICAESSVASDIAKELKGDFSLIQFDSVIKRIKRFFTNQLFDPYSFYDNIIRYVISTYKKKHSDMKVHIVFDHMFSHDNFTVFMITMRLGTQCIPIWFRCFKGKDNSNAFSEFLLKEGISYVSSLFDKSFELIFLADRWFGSTSLMEHIESLGHKYCIRVKGNIKVFTENKKTRDIVCKSAKDLQVYQYHSNIITNAEITEKRFKTNIVVSKKNKVSESWILATNNAPSMAINDYSKRFGGIETLFKNQKSNGLYIETVVNASEKYFTTMYTMSCFTILFLTILGADYSKNTKSYKNVKIITHKTRKGKKIRVMSLFNTGLTLFKRAFCASKYIRIPYNFTLYDI